MKVSAELWLVMLLIMMAHGEKKGKKDRKTSPQWKPSSMPDKGKKSEFVLQGNDVHLDCRAQAHPKPSIKWFKDGHEVKSDSNIEMKKFELVLKSSTTSMSGNYTCVVSNKHGQIEWTFNVNVHVDTRSLDIDGPKNITGTIGSNVTFSCHVHLHPVTIRWQKIIHNQTMDETAPNAVFLPDPADPQFLILNDIKREDEGEYRCMAGDVWGLKYASAWLHVIDRQETTTYMSIKTDNRNVYDDNNDVIKSGPSEGLDDNDSKNKNGNTTPYDSENSSEDIESFGFGFGTETSDNLPEIDEFVDDLYFTTTKQPKNNGNKRKKNGLKKDKKGKNKIRIEEIIITSTTVDSTTMLPATTTEDTWKTTTIEIWNYANNEKDEFSDGRNTAVKKDEMEEADTGSEKSTESENFKGNIRSWTIYTIVGAIGGVILLIGLLAITLTLCCKRDDNSIYKSTSV